MLSTTPIQRKLDNIDDPPYEKKGRGIPTTGSVARHIPIFSRVCAIKTAETPTQIKEA